MMSKSGYSPFAILKLVEDISLQGKQQIRFCKLVFTGLHCLRIVLNFAKLVLGPTIRRSHKKEHDASYPDFNH